MKQVEAHPLGEQDVGLDAGRQRHILHPAVDDGDLVVEAVTRDNLSAHGAESARFYRIHLEEHSEQVRSTDRTAKVEHTHARTHTRVLQNYHVNVLGQTERCKQ